MIDVQHLEANLPILGLGKPLHFFESIGSTNDEARLLAEKGAQHGTLVLADEQLSGRGRRGRAWYSLAGGGIAFSLILRPEAAYSMDNTLTVLGALAVVEALEAKGLEAQIKWPNDVIVPDGKLGGILVETSWRGNELEFAIVGIGVNVRQSSIPEEVLDFPAVSVEGVLGAPVDREGLLVDIIQHLGEWYPRMGSKELMASWQRHLAYRGEQVSIRGEGIEIAGQLQGLTDEGRLIVRLESGETVEAGEGDLTLRPIDSDKD